MIEVIQFDGTHSRLWDAEPSRPMLLILALSVDGINMSYTVWKLKKRSIEWYIIHSLYRIVGYKSTLKSLFAY